MPETPPTTKIDPHIVVCSDLHLAHGLFMSLAQAVEVCRILTKKSKTCTYRPVPIDLGENVEFIKGGNAPNIPDTPDDIDWGNRGGGYL